MEYATRVVQVGGDGDEVATFTAECACGFTSSGWAGAEVAAERMGQHEVEHSSGEPAPELVEFRESLGLNGEPVTVVDFPEGG